MAAGNNQKKNNFFQAIRDIINCFREKEDETSQIRGHGGVTLATDTGFHNSCCSSSVNDNFRDIVQRFGKAEASPGCGCGGGNVAGEVAMDLFEVSYTQEELAVFKTLEGLVNYKKTGVTPPPDFLTIDPANICNLKCPLCICWQNKANYKRGVMPFATFKTIVDKMPFLTGINMFGWGEPFLNPDLSEMIKYATSKRLITIVHSNFSFEKNDEFFKNIVESGLSNLVLSVDGATRDSYSKYRVGGDFDLVISNIRRLVKIKNQLQSITPVINWKFIVNKYNESEIETARKMANDLGVSFLTDEILLCDNIPDIEFEESIEKRKQDWLPENEQYIKSFYRGKYSFPLYGDSICPHLFQNQIVNWEGKILPCGWITPDENNIFGDLLAESFEDIWNNEKYQYSRNLFIPRNIEAKNLQTICSACKNFKKAA